MHRPTLSGWRSPLLWATTAALILFPVVLAFVVSRAATASNAISDAAEADRLIRNLNTATEAQSHVLSEYVAHASDAEPHDLSEHGHDGPAARALAGVHLTRDPQLMAASRQISDTAAMLTRTVPPLQQSLVASVLATQDALLGSMGEIEDAGDGMAGMEVYHGSTQELEHQLRSDIGILRARASDDLTRAAANAEEATRTLAWATPVLLFSAVASGWYIRRSLRARNRANELAATIEEKDRFIGTVSHELRTPLTAVLGFTEELISDTIMGPEDRRELLGIVSEQARDMSDLVEDLLLAARTDMGTVSIAPAVIDLADVSRKILDSHGSRMLIEVEAAQAPAVGDEIRVRQILRNLITNAGRYGRPPIRIRSGVDQHGPFMLVADHGEGVPDGMEEQIFEPYQTAHADNPAPGSVGLGLPVARHLARLMEGELTYGRIAGTTVFTLRLPPAPPKVERPPGPLGKPVNRLLA